jgi:hypothetical protein
MTAAEWLRCTNPYWMLMYLPATPYERKLRLLGCACCRRFLWDQFQPHPGRAAVETAERCADGLATRAELSAARRACLCDGIAEYVAWGRARYGLQCLLQHGVGAGDMYSVWVRRPRGSRAALVCDLLRDVIGNPFRPVPFAPTWRTPEALALARAVYDERRFEDLPVLADALEEAGCADRDILGHCRGKGEHARGCWVVDLVLGKE